MFQSIFPNFVFTHTISTVRSTLWIFTISKAQTKIRYILIVICSHFRTKSYKLHGPPMSVDQTDFGLVLYNHANLYRFEEHLVTGRLNKYQFFSAFHWSTSDTPPAPQCITVQ